MDLGVRTNLKMLSYLGCFRQIRKYGLIYSQTRCSAKTLAVIIKKLLEDRSVK